MSLLAMVTAVLLPSQRLRPDRVALLVLAALILLRLVSPGEALSGLSHPATVTVACLFVISAGFEASGLVGYLGDRLLPRGPLSRLALLARIGLVVAPLSAFMRNTTVVAVFLPIVVRACQGSGLNPSQLMMPLSFFAMLGCVCTLLGTPANLVVSTLAAEHGIEPFTMFEFARLGVILLLAAALYFVARGRRLLPERGALADPARGFSLNRYLSEVVVLEGSPLIGQSVVEAKLGERYQVEVFAHTRNKVMRSAPDGFATLEVGDVLAITAPADSLLRVGSTTGLALRPGRHPDVLSLSTAESLLVEAVITQNSDLEGRTLKGVNFRRRFGGTTLAIRRGDDLRERIGRLRLRVGDVLLIVVPRRELKRLKEQGSFVVLQEFDAPRLAPLRATAACLIVAGVVALAVTRAYPIALAAFLGAVLMVATGCRPARRVYRDIDWSVVLLLAGLIPLGIALETSGSAGQAVQGMLAIAGRFGPQVVLGVFLLLTSLLAGFLSGTATAVLLAPAAIHIARTLGVDPRPFLAALAFAASAGFWTPIGDVTHLLVYGPGGYRFADFVRVGGPLTLLHAALATLLIPLMFPFQ